MISHARSQPRASFLAHNRNQVNTETHDDMNSPAESVAKQVDNSNTDPVASSFRPLRIWPAVILLVLLTCCRFITTLWPEGPSWTWMVAGFGPMLCGLCLLIWWISASRATFKERIVGFFGVVVSAVALIAVVDKSMLGPAVMMITVPLGMFLFAVGAIICANLLSMKRTVVALVLAAIGFSVTTTLRSYGMSGDYSLDLDWRWNKSPEEMMLANDTNSVVPAVELSEAATEALKNPEWSDFRGPNRAAIQTGRIFSDDWTSNPPEEIWKIAVGPGWGSFVVAGDRLFTQEQRGDTECVVCYDAASGNQYWVHELQARFEDPLGGPGPRATPALYQGQLYCQGGDGMLLKLDAATGEADWQVNLLDVADCKKPMWGFCASPLVIGDVVITYAGGEGDDGTLGFDTETGEVKWAAQTGNMSYSSPHPLMVEDERLFVMLCNEGCRVFDPATGDCRLNYEWEHSGYRSLQPAIIDDTMIIPTGLGSGTRRIRLINTDGKLTAEELWTSRYLKPDFNDLVVHEGSVYGFDDSIFTCVDLETGKRQWKGGRYGKGQVMLLADSDLLIVITEKGQLKLLRTNSEKHEELASIEALEGKTWNHLVVVGDRLYIRNSQQAACYRLQ